MQVWVTFSGDMTVIAFVAPLASESPPGRGLQQVDMAVKAVTGGGAGLGSVSSAGVPNRRSTVSHAMCNGGGSGHEWIR